MKNTDRALKLMKNNTYGRTGRAVMKNTDRAVKIIQASDGALVETTVMDSLISDWYNDKGADLDQILALNKKAIDHLQNLRVLLQTEIVAGGS